MEVVFDNAWQKPMDDRVKMFQHFHCRQNTRPLFGFFKGSEYPLTRYPFSRTLPESRALLPADFDVAAFVNDSEQLFLEHEACGGDFIYSASAFWGIPWLEAALGCPVFANHSTGSIHSEPPPGFSVDSLPAFERDNPWMRLMVEMLHALAERAAGRFPLATTRMRGVADLLSALYGADAFVYAMFDKPDEVMEVCRRVTDLFIQCGNLQLQHIPDFYGGIGSFYYHMWAPKGTVWHQEDAAALLSPELYAQFIEPFDRRIVTSFPHVVMHQHSTGFVPTDKYLAMGMSVLELHIDKGGPAARDLYERHAAILKRCPLLIWGDISTADLDWIFGKLPLQGLAIIKVVKDASQAEQLWKRYFNEQ
ncbi:MAG: uroporphyrinogen decarboxylase family protein [Kiritimatiellae bacterium]|nr:uroporphyrinogen decarboxylase family protein [Kiritimatiellia bacterium]